MHTYFRNYGETKLSSGSENIIHRDPELSLIRIHDTDVCVFFVFLNWNKVEDILTLAENYSYHDKQCL